MQIIKRLEELKVGDAAVICRTVSDEDMRMYKLLSRDSNPLHLSNEIAKRSRFGEIISWGLLTGLFTAEALSKLLPGTMCLSQSFEYVMPVYVGDELHIEVVIDEILAGMRVVEVKYRVWRNDCISGEEKTVLRGSAMVQLLEELE